MIYIASPYSHPDFAIMEQRYHVVRAFTAEGLKQGFMVYSPIVHCHELAKATKLPTDFAFWMKYNKHMIGRASAMIVLALEGWLESKGVMGEIEFCDEVQVPVSYAYPTGPWNEWWKKAE